MRLGTASADDLLESNSPRLRIITRSGVGYDSIHPEGCRARDIVVTNLPGANAQVRLLYDTFSMRDEADLQAVAELALTLTLSVLRRIKEMDRRFISGEILRSIHSLAPGLTGKTVGIVGMGNTARHFALLLRPFRCRLLVYSPTSSSHRWTDSDPDLSKSGDAPIAHERVDLERILREADVISLHCPLLPETKNLISEKELGMMKPNTVLINTARGGVVDERALERALQAGKLAGAGIDVWEIEPARGDNLGELGKMNNVICLPHL
jgi:D-3-phosphoglycerate dehydrogenase